MNLCVLHAVLIPLGKLGQLYLKEIFEHAWSDVPQGSGVQNHSVAPRSTQPFQVNKMRIRNFWDLSGKK